MVDITAADLHRWRTRNELSWDEVGRRCGMSRSVIYRVEIEHDAVMRDRHALALEAAAWRLAVERNDLGCLLPHQKPLLAALVQLATGTGEA